MRVLSVTSECVPLIKTGGLADVAGALPGALAPLGVEMRTLLPGYPQVMKAARRGTVLVEEDDLFGGPAKVIAARVGALDLLVLDAPHLYDRPGNPYLGKDGRDWPDNPRRFAALSRVAARIGAEGAALGWQPDLLHGHDWQAGLVRDYQIVRGGVPVPFVFTIHNIAFQGLAPAEIAGDLGLPEHRGGPDGWEFWGRLSALKAGLTGADRLTTVSPTYAAELMREEFGMGFDGLLRHRREDLVGILNGIDTEVWDPATDPEIHQYKTLKGKARAKTALRREFGLGEVDGPLCVVVSRLTEQKGLDVLLEALPALVDRGGQLVLLGSGDRLLEEAFRKAAAHPHVAVHIGYDEALSHRIIAGGDAILVPSRFEPCGLTQLYGLRYGTIPIVAHTGGLADTVINASPMAMARGVATGLQFTPVTSDALAGTLMRAVRLYKTPGVWQSLVKEAMKAPVGWETSARAYADLYRDLARD